MKKTRRSTEVAPSDRVTDTHGRKFVAAIVKDCTDFYIAILRAVEASGVQFPATAGDDGEAVRERIAGALFDGLRPVIGSEFARVANDELRRPKDSECIRSLMFDVRPLIAVDEVAAVLDMPIGEMLAEPFARDVAREDGFTRTGRIVIAISHFSPSEILAAIGNKRFREIAPDLEETETDRSLSGPARLVEITRRKAERVVRRLRAAELREVEEAEAAGSIGRNTRKRVAVQ